MSDDRSNTATETIDQNVSTAPSTEASNDELTAMAGGGASGAPAPAPDYSDAGALSAPDRQGDPTIWQGQPPQNAPATAAPTQKPSMWRNVVMGALVGMAGGAGEKTFAGGVGSGARSSLAYTQLQRENARKDQETQMQKEQHESTIKFQTAQAASLAADTALKDARLHNLPQEEQDQHTSNALEQLKTMEGLGLTPTIVVPNNAGGAEAKAGLQQLTDSHGGVPPLFTINLGDRVIGFDLNQLSAAPQALGQINKIRALQGQQPLDSQTWSQMPAALKISQTNTAFNFWMPEPSEQNLMVYKNYLDTAKAQPDSPDKAANVAQLQGTVDRMKTTLDAGLKRMQQITDANVRATIPAEAAKQGAVEYAKKRAENKADAEANPPNNLTGTSYLDSLPAADQATVRAVMEGRMSMTPTMLRSKEGLRITQMVNQADPGFDMSRAPAYSTTRKAFESGDVAKGINHINVAIQHLGKLYDASTFTSTGVTGAISRDLVQPFSGTATNATAFKVELQRVQDELAHVYDNKSLTDSDKAEIRKGAAGIDHWSANSNKADMQALAGLLQSKLHAYKSQWDNAKPSAAIPDFPVISPESATILNKLHKQDPKMVDAEELTTPAASRTTQPLSHTGTVPVGAQPIMRNGQPVGFIQNGKRVDF